MPSRKEIQWSQLKVGALILVALALLTAIVFLMTSASGGLFARRIELRCYFPNAGGLKDGAVVTLEGVTIGNVIHLRVIPRRNPNPVEVTMQVGEKYAYDLHTDSVASIQAAGVLGDSFVDIDSTHASGPRPANGAELQQSGSPTIQSVINTSQVSIQEINVLIHKIETLTDTLNSSRGTVGELINDPGLKKNVASIAANLQTVTQGSGGRQGNDWRADQRQHALHEAELYGRSTEFNSLTDLECRQRLRGQAPQRRYLLQQLEFIGVEPEPGVGVGECGTRHIWQARQRS